MKTADTSPGLSPAQRAAAETDARRELIVAGPGSGKTTTLVQRILHIGRAVPGPEMVAITYTVAAAGELKKRLAAVGLGKLGWCGTLHSFMLKLVREHHALLRLPAELGVVDDTRREALLGQVVADLGVKVSMKKALAMLEPAKVFCDAPSGATRTKEQLAAIEYYRRLRREGLLDFNTVLHYGRLVVESLCAVGRWPYRALFWDEYQDSSAEDAGIMEAMDCEWKTVVGDPDQSIYSFRGGDVSGIVSLASLAGNPKSGSEWEVHELEENHRCRHEVAEAAQRLVERNPGRVPKRTVAVKPGGEVEVHRCPTVADEMCLVLQRIGDMVHARCEDMGPEAGAEAETFYKDTAVLCRTNRQAEQFAEFLAARGVPVSRRPEPADPPDWPRALALLTALSAPWSDSAVRAYLELRDGREKADAARAAATRAMKSLDEACCQFFSKTSPVAAMEAEGVSPESMDRVNEALNELVTTGEHHTDRKSLGDALLYLRSRERPWPDGGGGVTVATLHAAKGREWANVFVVGCEEGLLPSAKSVKADANAGGALDGKATQEERRLMFVGMTRAEDRLTLSWCAERPVSRGPNLPPGPAERREPSRFLGEAGLL